MYPFAPCKGIWIPILGDPGAESGDEGKSKRAEKYGTKKRKERREELLGTMSYQTSSKRSPSFWLLIGARKLVFFWHQSEARTAATVWNWSGETLSPGALLAVLYFSSFHIYFSTRLDFPSPLLSAPGSPKMLDSGIREIFACGLLMHLLWNPEYNARNPNPTDALINVKPAWEGGGRRSWGGDLAGLSWPWGRALDRSCSTRRGNFESFFALRGTDVGIFDC